MNNTSFRNNCGFGKRMEYFIISKMLEQNLDVYIPLVDDIGIDAIVRKNDKSFVQVQIKARSNEVKDGNAALFAGITHPERENYFFILYSQRLDVMWIFSSTEFVKLARRNKTGKNTGKYSIKLNGTRKGKEYPLDKYKAFICEDFEKIFS